MELSVLVCYTYLVTVKASHFLANKTCLASSYLNGALDYLVSYNPNLEFMKEIKKSHKIVLVDFKGAKFCGSISGIVGPGRGADRFFSD